VEATAPGRPPFGYGLVATHDRFVLRACCDEVESRSTGCSPAATFRAPGPYTDGFFAGTSEAFLEAPQATAGQRKAGSPIRLRRGDGMARPVRRVGPSAREISGFADRGSWAGRKKRGD